MHPNFLSPSTIRNFGEGSYLIVLMLKTMYIEKCDNCDLVMQLNHRDIYEDFFLQRLEHHFLYIHFKC